MGPDHPDKEKLALDLGQGGLNWPFFNHLVLLMLSFDSSVQNEQEKQT